MKLVIVTDEQSYDWQRLYVDGALRYDGHSIPDYVYQELLEEAGVKTDEHFVDQKWFDENTGSYLDESVLL